MDYNVCSKYYWFQKTEIKYANPLHVILSDFFLKSAEVGLQDQKTDGSMPPGRNGPHNDPETPVRNTSHWLIFFLKAYQLSGDPRFEKSAQRCLYWLMSKKARPGAGVFHHRMNPEKDAANGLMGQAWTMEALVYAWNHFKEPGCLKIAEELFLLHYYDSEVQCWRIADLDGSPLSFDRTFNHQLWFASAGWQLIEAGVDSVKESTEHFTRNIGKNISLYRDGVIRHYPYGYSRKETVRRKAGRFAHNLKELFGTDKALYSHSVGYHAFNTYALRVISGHCPEAPFFATSEWKRAVRVFADSDFQSTMVQSKFGYPYNPPGIEAAVTLEGSGVFPKETEEQLIQTWLGNQFRISFNFETRRMSLNTPDPVTLHARMYELWRLSSFEYEVAP